MQQNKILAEMTTHIPLCTHYEAKEVFVFGTVGIELKNELEKHKKESNINFFDILELEKLENKSADVVILSDINLELKLISNIFRVLKDDGLFVAPSKSYFQNFDILKKDLTLLGNNFWIAMPYSFSHSTMILGSKKYHPTADLNLHRADFLENMEYYSSDIHLASFVFPAKIHKELTGFSKR